MLKSTLVLFILALAALNASAAQGAGQGEAADADRLNAQVLKLYREGKYEEALPVAKRVIELREKALGGEDLRVAFALANLGNIYARKGEPKEAEPLFKRALAMAEKFGAAETEFSADLHTQLGLMRVNSGKYREAEPLLRRVLEIKEKVHGAESPKLIPALLNLVDVNFLRGQPRPAHTLLGRALSLLTLQPPTKDTATAQRLRNYQCLLLGSTEAKNEELAKQVSRAAWRLEAPESAAKFEREEKERKAREARGEVEQSPDAGGVLNGKAISKPQPGYPAAAKQEGVSGVVIVQILVDESGKVVKAEPVCGHPLLAKEAVAAALKARFTPTLLSGLPVKVSGVITYNFVLQ